MSKGKETCHILCSNFTGSEGQQEGGIHDQIVWSIKECGKIFEDSVAKLKVELNKQGDGGMLIWDKVRNKYLLDTCIQIL